jgi:hypothetical protein
MTERVGEEATVNTDYIADLAKEEAYRSGIDDVHVSVTPDADGKLRVELSVQVRSTCPVCGQSAPDARSPVQHGCGAWISPVRVADMIDPDSDDLDYLIEALADRLAGLVMRQEEELRAEATERARELHREVIEALSRGDTSLVHDEVPQYGDYTILIGQDLMTCAEVKAATVDLWDTADVSTPVHELPEAAQETLRRRKEEEEEA